MNKVEDQYRDIEQNWKSILSKAPGPSPWYFSENSPALTGEYTSIKWKHRLFDRTHHYLKADGNCLGIVSYYVYVYPVNNAFFVWGSDENDPHHLKIELYDVNRLQPITDIKNSLERLKTKQRWGYYFEGGLLSKVAIPMHRSELSFEFTFPEKFKVVNELLVLGRGVHGVAIYCLRPQDDKVEVYPQDWFNDDPNRDFGYEWITRVARDNDSGMIVGSGIRVNPFVLDKSNRSILLFLPK